MIVVCTNDSLIKYDQVKESVARLGKKYTFTELGKMWPGYGEILDLV